MPVKINNDLERATDMPKIHAPFKREETDEGYYCVDEVSEGFEWVFKDDEVKATEKINGTDVSIVVEDGNIQSIWNRKNRVRKLSREKPFIVKGILNSRDRGYTELQDGQWFGELVGPKVNGNPYELEKHLWIPFRTYCWDKLVYKSWGKYPKTYEGIRGWMNTLIPLFWCKIHGKSFDEAEEENAYVEGLVFVGPDGKLAKLRRGMFNISD